MKDKFFELGEYTYNLLIDWFKQKDSIKIVRMYGSRYRGGARKSSDIDFLLEGTFQHDMIYNFKQEINSLKHPYRIDFVDIKSEESMDSYFTERNFKISEIFYLRSDYFPEETYVEQGPKGIREFEFYPRWVYRYRSYFMWKFEEFMPDVNDMIISHENNYDDIQAQIDIFGRFKNIFEGCWKLLKDYAKDEFNKKIFLPREIFEFAQEKNIIKNKKVWTDMIYDFKIMTDCPFVEINDEMIYRLKIVYMPAMIELREYFKAMFEEVINA